MSFKRFSPYLALPLLMASPATAQEMGGSTLHILRPMIHAEQDRAELCLEFDHDLSETARAKINLRLESDGKKTTIAPQNLNLSGSTLCVSDLVHRQLYHLSLSGVKGSKDERLAETYLLSFTVPDRKASLAFLSDLVAGGLMRWQNNDPVLRGINVEQAKIELYRIDSLPLITEAWRQHRQTTLAPTESAYFARDKGTLVWQGNVDLAKNPNNVVEQKVPLQKLANTVTPGFYLVVASAPAVKDPADPKDKNELAPLAAAWLLRSDLKLQALRDNDTIVAVAEKADASSVTPNIRILLQDDNQQTLAEGRSDNEGLARLTPPDNKRKAATLVGVSDKGDLDFVNLSTRAKDPLVASVIEAKLQTDKNFYVPGSNAIVSLNAQDAQGKAFAPVSSNLQILRPDKSFFTSLDIPQGTTAITVPVPTNIGIWTLQWQQEGKIVATVPLNVTSNSDAPHLEVKADHSQINGSDITLTLSSVTDSGKAAAYVAGTVKVEWVNDEQVFAGWSDYHFGNNNSVRTTEPQILSFVTDAKGQTQLHIHNLPVGSAASILAARITVRSDAVAGALAPSPLIIPVKPATMIIGVKALADDARFAENSLARFDVIALNGEGLRINADDLNFRIIEEGRHFDWYQDSGRWNYKPLAQTRRLGGGSLNVSEKDSNRIEWPVNAGTYRLEVTDADGKILAQLPFSAGWSAAQNEAAKPNPLNLSVSAPDLKAGTEETIAFHLDAPSVVTLTVADTRIRKTLHQMMPAGNNSFSFIPEASWANRIKVSAYARNTDNDGNITAHAGEALIHLQHGMGQTAATAATPAIVPSFAVTGDDLPVLHKDDQIPYDIHLQNNNATPGNYHYTVTALAGLKLATPVTGTISIPQGQTRDIHVVLNTTQAGNASFTLDLNGPHNFRLSRNWQILTIKDDLNFDTSESKKIESQQNWGSTDSAFNLVAAEPLYATPHMLSVFLQNHSFTTAEIADELETLRLWHDILIQTDLLPEQRFITRQRHLLQLLIARQNTDGSFAKLEGVDGDIASTASALIALSAHDTPLAKLATQQAANWLHHQLENSWFDEKLRAERASAYAALAIAGRTDIANLHYFSDTSAEKKLPSLAAAQLALAFDKAGDADAARYWLSPAKISEITPELLTTLSLNNQFDTHKLLPVLEKLSGNKEGDLKSAFVFLQTMANLQNRAGIWRLSINSIEQSLKNIFVATNQQLHNPGDRPLYVAEAHPAKNQLPVDASIMRHIFKPNGIELMAGDALDKGAIYLIVNEGEWPKATNKLVARDTIGPAMTPVSCALDTHFDAGDELSWIKNLPLNPISVCEKNGSHLQVLIESATTDTRKWSFSYFAKAERSGIYLVNALQIRALGDDAEDTAAHQSSRLKLRVQ